MPRFNNLCERKAKNAPESPWTRFASPKRAAPGSLIHILITQTDGHGRAGERRGLEGESRTAAPSAAPVRSGRRSSRTGAAKVGRPPNRGHDSGGVGAHRAPAAGREGRWSRGVGEGRTEGRRDGRVVRTSSVLRLLLLFGCRLGRRGRESLWPLRLRHFGRGEFLTRN